MQMKQIFPNVSYLCSMIYGVPQSVLNDHESKSQLCICYYWSAWIYFRDFKIQGWKKNPDELFLFEFDGFINKVPVLKSKCVAFFLHFFPHFQRNLNFSGSVLPLEEP